MFQSLLLLTVLAHLTPLPVQAPTAQVAPQRPVQRPADLPSGERWLRHFNEDLLPFWNVPEAWGTPRGDFPTFRGNDGKAVDWTKLPEELATAPGWIKANYGRDYVRMKSRQTYFYGVAYHLTGDPKLLELARAGAMFIRKRALDPRTVRLVSVDSMDAHPVTGDHSESHPPRRE